MRNDTFVDIILQLSEKELHPEQFQKEVTEVAAEYMSTVTLPQTTETETGEKKPAVAVVEFVCPTCKEINQTAWIEESLSENKLFHFDRIPFYLWIKGLVGREVFCEHCHDRISFVDPFWSVYIDIGRHIVPKNAMNDRELEALESLQHEVLKAYAGLSEYEIRYRDKTQRSASEVIRQRSDGETEWGAIYRRLVDEQEKERMRKEAQDERDEYDKEALTLYEKKQARHKRKADRKKPALARKK